MSELALLNSFSEISAAEWDAMAAPGQAPEPVAGRELSGEGPGRHSRPADPFTTWRFFAALESSGSVGPGTGWQPRPLVLREDGLLVAALPLWVKSHSQGEYVFDHSWADAFERAGGRYYPKLQVAVPFTPVPGPRFLGPARCRETLAEAAISITDGNGLSSLHLTFCSAEEAAALEGFQGLMRRQGQQFHWLNRGYRCFDDFLGDLSSRKRKMIRKERATAQSYGLEIRSFQGDQITPGHWQAFWAFYQDTGARKWGQPYLTRAAFDAFHASMREDILLVMAFDQGRPVAGALNFIGREALFGRYWGTIGDYPALHFELCYYQAIDYAIAQGLARVEAGAQGGHKLARGYLPVPTWSLHWIRDPGFRRAVAAFLDEETEAVAEETEILTGYGPFRRGGEDEGRP